MMKFHTRRCMNQRHTRTEVRIETDNFCRLLFSWEPIFNTVKQRSNQKIDSVTKIQSADIATETTDFEKIFQLQKIRFAYEKTLKTFGLNPVFNMILGGQKDRHGQRQRQRPQRPKLNRLMTAYGMNPKNGHFKRDNLNEYIH